MIIATCDGVVSRKSLVVSRLLARDEVCNPIPIFIFESVIAVELKIGTVEL